MTIPNPKIWLCFLIKGAGGVKDRDYWNITLSWAKSMSRTFNYIFIVLWHFNSLCLCNKKLMLSLSLCMFVIQNTNTIFKVEGDNKVTMFGNLLQVLSKRVNTSLSKTKMVITLLFEHLLIWKTQIKEAEIVSHKIL